MAIKVRKKKKVEVRPDDDLHDLELLERQLKEEIEGLQRLAKSKKKNKEFKKRFNAAEKSHKKAVLKGKTDGNYDAFLDQAMSKARKQLKSLKEDLEMRRTPRTRIIVPAGMRPPEKRDIPIFITVNELRTIVHSLWRHADFLSIANDKPMRIHKVDKSCGKGSLAGYLLRAAIEAGAGWQHLAGELDVSEDT
jgi:hypothetical protein